MILTRHQQRCIVQLHSKFNAHSECQGHKNSASFVSTASANNSQAVYPIKAIKLRVVCCGKMFYSACSAWVNCCNDCGCGCRCLTRLIKSFPRYSIGFKSRAFDCHYRTWTLWFWRKPFDSKVVLGPAFCCNLAPLCCFSGGTCGCKISSQQNRAVRLPWTCTRLVLAVTDMPPHIITLPPPNLFTFSLQLAAKCSSRCRLTLARASAYIRQAHRSPLL